MIIENGVLKSVDDSDISINKDERIVMIPEEVVEIEKRVFFGKKITTIIYTENLKRIGDYAFSNSSIAKMYSKDNETGFVCLEGNIESVGRESFSRCKSIKGAKIDCKMIGTAAFENCEKLGVVFCGENVSKLGNFAFKSCRNLRDFKTKNGKIELGLGVFTFDTKLNVEELSKTINGDYARSEKELQEMKKAILSGDTNLSSEEINEYVDDFFKENKVVKNGKFNYVDEMEIY